MVQGCVVFILFKVGAIPAFQRSSSENLLLDARTQMLKICSLAGAQAQGVPPPSSVLCFPFLEVGFFLQFICQMKVIPVPAWNQRKAWCFNFQVAL